MCPDYNVYTFNILNQFGNFVYGMKLILRVCKNECEVLHCIHDQSFASTQGYIDFTMTPKKGEGCQYRQAHESLENVKTYVFQLVIFSMI